MRHISAYRYRHFVNKVYGLYRLKAQHATRPPGHHASRDRSPPTLATYGILGFKMIDASHIIYHDAYILIEKLEVLDHAARADATKNDYISRYNTRYYY